MSDTLEAHPLAGQVVLADLMACDILVSCLSAQPEVLALEVPLLRAFRKVSERQVQVSERLAQDIAAEEAAVAARVAGLASAPKPIPYQGRYPSRSPIQNELFEARVRELEDLGARDFLVDQTQVNIFGIKVGINRPDLQYTLNNVRYYEEFDRFSSQRGYEHQARIYQNDPLGKVLLWQVKE